MLKGGAAAQLPNQAGLSTAGQCIRLSPVNLHLPSKSKSSLFCPMRRRQGPQRAAELGREFCQRHQHATIVAECRSVDKGGAAALHNHAGLSLLSVYQTLKGRFVLTI